MILDCSHHYCRECGQHGSYTIELSHKKGCWIGEYEMREAKKWEDYRARRKAGEGGRDE